MPLPETVVPVIFNKGIDTKTDDKLVTNKLIQADNAVYTSGVPTKRNGYVKLSSEDLIEGNALLRYKRELLNFGNGKARSYAEPLQNWIDKGNYQALSVDVDSIVKNSNIIINPTSGVTNSIVVTAWDEIKPTVDSTDGSLSLSNLGVRASVFTEKSETYYITDEVISTTGKHPRVATLGNVNYIFYVEGGNLRWKSIGSGNPTALQSDAGALFTDMHTDGIYKIKPFYTGFLCVYKQNTGKVRVAYITSTGVVGTASNTYFAAKTIDVLIDQNLELFTVQDIDEVTAWIVFKDTSDQLQFVTTSFSLSLSSPLDADTSTEEDIRNMTMIKTEKNKIDLYFDVVGTDERNALIKKQPLELGTVASVAATVFKRSVSLASQAFEYNDKNFFTVKFQDILQSSFFTLNTDGCTVAKFAGPLSAGEFYNATILNPFITGTKFPNFLPEVTLDNGKAIGIFPIRNDPTFANTVRYFKQGISAISLDFINFTYTSDELAENAIISGGLTYLYDGNKVTEFGFNTYPETIIVKSVGTLQENTVSPYSFVVTYAWVDNQGKTHRSYASDPVEDDFINPIITVPTLRLTEKDDVEIELWRTLAGGTTYRRVAIVPNDTESDSMDISSVILNSNWTPQLQLATTTGALQPESPQSCRIVKTHKNRVFIAGVDNRNKIQYSKRVSETSTLEFSAFFTLAIDPVGGDITALESMEDWMVIFKRNDILILSGNGPDNLGLGNPYVPPRLIAGDVGALHANATQIMPEGIMFKSEKGIYLLSRELKPIYIGADVEAFNDFTVTSMKLVDDRNEVRITTQGTKEINGNVYTNPVLVFNYHYNVWSVFTNISAVDAQIYEGDYVYLEANGKVNRETEGIYKDNGTDVNIRLTTAWIKLTQLQGFQRVKWIYFLGEYKSKHFLNIEIRYDYKKNEIGGKYYYFPDGNVLRNIPANFDSTFGDDDEFGDSDVFGGDDDGTYDFGLKPDLQKCESIQISVYDSVNSTVAGGGESFNLSAINLQIAQKQGMNKLNRNKKVATV